MLHKRVLASFLCISLFSGAPSTYAYKQLNLYAGAKVNKNSYKMKKAYGNKIFKQNPLSLEAFLGHKINDNYFVEFSYEQTSKNHRTNTLVAGDYAPGQVLIIPGSFDIFKTTYQLKQPTVYFGYSIPVDHIAQDLEANISIGLSLTKLLAQFEVIEDEFGPLNQALIDASRRTFKERKIIPSIRAGADYKINDSIKLKLNATWKNLSRFSPKSKERPDLSTQVRMKNSLSFGFGFEFAI